jgi:DNA polymerase III delta prime subunit
MEEVCNTHTHTHTHTHTLLGTPHKHLLSCCVCNCQIPYNDSGLEAISFTADGDMRQAINNLQATYTGFGYISAENVFKVLLGSIYGQ